MKKLFIMLLVGFLVMGTIYGAGASEEDQVVEKTFNLKISTAANPTQTHTRALYKFKEFLEASTDRITVEVYDSSTLFKQDANITSMLKGNLEMCFTDASWLAEYMPSLTMFTTPYLYKDYNHMAKVLSGEIGTNLFDSIATEIGVRPLGAYYLGSRTINLRKDKEITSRKDMEGIQLRVPNSATWIYMGKALGANPVAMGFGDTYLALQTGAVDGQDNPLGGTLNAKFTEVTESVTLTNHSIGTVWLAIAEQVWQEMDSDLQDKVMEAVSESKDWCDEYNLDSESKLAQEFRDLGLKVYEPDMTNYKNEVFGYYLDDVNMSGEWDMDLYNDIISQM